MVLYGLSQFFYVYIYILEFQLRCLCDKSGAPRYSVRPKLFIYQQRVAYVVCIVPYGAAAAVAAVRA